MICMVRLLRRAMTLNEKMKSWETRLADGTLKKYPVELRINPTSFSQVKDTTSRSDAWIDPGLKYG